MEEKKKSPEKFSSLPLFCCYQKSGILGILYGVSFLFLLFILLYFLIFQSNKDNIGLEEQNTAKNESV